MLREHRLGGSNRRTSSQLKKGSTNSISTLKLSFHSYAAVYVGCISRLQCHRSATFLSFSLAFGTQLRSHWLRVDLNSQMCWSQRVNTVEVDSSSPLVSKVVAVVLLQVATL